MQKNNEFKIIVKIENSDKRENMESDSEEVKDLILTALRPVVEKLGEIEDRVELTEQAAIAIIEENREKETKRKKRGCTQNRRRNTRRDKKVEDLRKTIEEMNITMNRAEVFIKDLREELNKWMNYDD